MQIKVGSEISHKVVKEVITHFPVLHHAWEGDEYGYIVKFEDGSIHPVLSNHGNLYIANVSEIDDIIAFYRQTIKITEDAIARWKESV